MSIFDDLKKALELGLQGYMAKARQNLKAPDEYVIERKALSGLDKYDENEAGYKERMSAVTFDILRQMAMRDSIVSSIIMTRVNQLKAFGLPQNTKYDVGFKIVMRDSEKDPDDNDKKLMKELEQWFLHTGSVEGRPDSAQHCFSDFLGMISRDILIYDQAAVETVNAKDGSLAYFIPSSAGSMRLASKNLAKQKDLIAGAASRVQLSTDADAKKEQDILASDAKKDEPYSYVQIYQGQIVRGFFPEEMILAMLNPVTDLEANGYSVGPLELLANIVSYHLFAEAHNRLFFVQGFASRGILHIEGDIPSHHLEAFRRQWREQLSGTQNSWRTPILAGGEKINWIPLQATNRDMEWSAWMEYLIKIICALFAIAPQEINFDITRQQGASLGDSGAKNDSVLTDSRIRGLWPILAFLENIMNEKLLRRFNEEYYAKYKFVFCGLDLESREKELERIDKETSTFKTINEIRSEHDLEPIEGGDIVRDPNYIQSMTNAQMPVESPEGNPADEIPGDFANDSPNTDSSKDIDEVDSVTKSMAKKYRKPELMKIEYWKK